MAYIIQVLNGDTETHYCNPVWFTSVIEDSEEARGAFESLIKEYEDFARNEFGGEVEWETGSKGTLTELRAEYPFEVIFTIDQVSGDRSNLTEFLRKKFIH